MQKISAYLQGIPEEVAYLKPKEILCYSVHNEPLELIAVHCYGGQNLKYVKNVI